MSWPPCVGIIAMEVYFPRYSVLQSDLEIFDGVLSGKYTTGLGQLAMAYTGDREDIVSMSLTVVRNLLIRTLTSVHDIGYLEVGTETIIDKSKSVKTHLMNLFSTFGNSSIEAVDSINACYGGTASLFHAIQWIDSGHWDGRLAIVVCADIAVYEKGPARPTGGCGAVAMLIGPSSPIVIERGLRSTFMTNAYDFYKPFLSSEYPIVDGKLSISCYLKALDACYVGLAFKWKHRLSIKTVSNETFTLKSFDYACFHCPYIKLVRKSFARLLFNDARRFPQSYPRLSSHPLMQKVSKADSIARENERRITGYRADTDPILTNVLNDTFEDRSLEKILMEESEELYQEKVLPSIELSAELGNTYTAAVYCCLLSLLSNIPISQLCGGHDKRILMFSYGSGLAASMFIIRIKSNQLLQLKTGIGASTNGSLSLYKDRLRNRITCTPVHFDATLSHREKVTNSRSYVPTDSLNDLYPGTFYLNDIDAKFRRNYSLSTPNCELFPQSVSKM